MRSMRFAAAEELKDCLEKAREAQMQRMQSSKENIAVAYLYLNLLQETVSSPAPSATSSAPPKASGNS